MAISGTLLDDGTSSGTGNAVTEVIAPTANALVLAAVSVYSAEDVTGITSITHAGSLTLDLVATAAAIDDGFGDYVLRLYRALSASPGSGAITIDPSATSGSVQVDWCVAEFTGVDTGGTNGADAVVQSPSNTTNDNATLTVTLSAFGAAENGAAGYAVTYNNGTITHETNWTELDSNVSQLHAQWRADNDTTCTFVSSNGSDDLAGIAVEIKAAGGGEPPIENAPEVLRVVRSPIRFR
jgi:hypothetical protein